MIGNSSMGERVLSTLSNVKALLKSQDQERIATFINQYQSSIMHLAAAHNDYELVDLFIENKADVDATDEVGNTSLHYAASYASHKTVELLIAGGADIDAVGRDGKMPLLCAAEGGNEQAFFLLLVHDVDLNEAGQEQMNDIQKFGDYYSIFKKIEKEPSIEYLLKSYLNGCKYKEFQKRKKKLISDLTKIKEDFQDFSEFVVLGYIYDIIVDVVINKCLLTYFHSEKDEIFASGALAGIIQEYSHKQEKCINPFMSLEKHGYGLKDHKSVLNSISKTVTESAEAASGIYWEQEISKSVLFLNECKDICITPQLKEASSSNFNPLGTREVSKDEIRSFFKKIDVVDNISIEKR